MINPPNDTSTRSLTATQAPGASKSSEGVSSDASPEANADTLIKKPSANRQIDPNVSSSTPRTPDTLQASSAAIGERSKAFSAQLRGDSMDASASGLPKHIPSSGTPDVFADASSARSYDAELGKDTSQGSRRGLGGRLSAQGTAESALPGPSTTASSVGQHGPDLERRSLRLDAGTADGKLDVSSGAVGTDADAGHNALNDTEPEQLQGDMVNGFSEDGAASADADNLDARSISLSRPSDSDDAVFPLLGGGALGVFWALLTGRRSNNRKVGGASALGDASDAANPDEIKEDEMSFQIVGQKRSGLGGCGHSASLQGNCTVCNRLVRPPGEDAIGRSDDPQSSIIGSPIR